MAKEATFEIGNICAFRLPDFCVKKLNVKTPSCQTIICFTLTFSTRIP